MPITERQIREAWKNLAKSSPVIIEGKNDFDHNKLLEFDYYHSLVETLAARFCVAESLVNVSISYDWDAYDRGERNRHHTHYLSFKDEQSATKFILGLNSDQNFPYRADVPKRPDLTARLVLKERLG